MTRATVPGLAKCAANIVNSDIFLAPDIAKCYIFVMTAILWTGSARRALRALPAKVQSRIGAKPTRYAETGAGDVRVILPGPGRRLRVGDYRIIFVEAEEHIEVRAVGHRRGIYR